MGRREVLLSEGFAAGIKKELHPIFLGVELFFIIGWFQLLFVLSDKVPVPWLRSRVGLRC
jgi:hypothetical protein